MTSQLVEWRRNYVYTIGINAEQKNMTSVVVILLMIGTFIHDSCALKCYNCTSPLGGNCDDPLDADKTPVITCPGEANACSTRKGTIFFGGTQHNVQQFMSISFILLLLLFCDWFFDAKMCSDLQLDCPILCQNWLRVKESWVTQLNKSGWTLCVTCRTVPRPVRLLLTWQNSKNNSPT